VELTSVNICSSEWQIPHKRKFASGMGLQPEHPFYKKARNGRHISA